MGEIIGLRCSGCGKSWNIKLGHGLLHWNKDAIINEFSAEKAESVKTFYDINESPFFSFVPVICKTCRDFVSVPAIFPDANKQNVGIWNPCPVCNNINTIPVLEGKELVCPRCSCNKIDWETLGTWD